MRAKGITYDSGLVHMGVAPRHSLEPGVVRRELSIIRDDLHCNAVRVIGGDPERLELAASCAADLGLEVWFSPYPLEMTTDGMLALFSDCAARAERVRRQGAEVVFVAGAELSAMNHGFLPGASVDERLRTLLGGEPDRRRELIVTAAARVNVFLAQCVPIVRERFAGRLTYAAIPFERVDWAPFDIVSADLYRSAAIAGQFRDGVRRLVAQGKPVAITEFGTATYRGAGDLGGQCLDVAEFDPSTREPVRMKGEYIRDEPGQARYIRELLDVYDREGVDSAFVFAFALHGFPHRPDGDPRDDLDLASLGIVKMLENGHGQSYPDMPWEPKAAFGAVADFYGSH